MSLLLILIPLSLVLVGVAVWAFIWAVGSGQFDDMETPAWEILTDDTPTVDQPTLPPTDNTNGATWPEK